MIGVAAFANGFVDGLEGAKKDEELERPRDARERNSGIPGIADAFAPGARRAGGGAQRYRPADDDEFGKLFLETADELEMEPETLGTLMSYETAGTMDPMQPGPTTQWGQHRGFIQFGEPQAKEHGVDFTNRQTALRSQLGRNGAVVSYFRKNGWKPGMGELDAYSIINAGGPGLYNRSDAHNGGAPGTVRDKVEKQMHGHRLKAQAMLRGMMPQQAERAPGIRDDQQWKWFRRQN